MGASSLKLSFLSVLIISVLWKPAYADKCSLTCKGSSTFPKGEKYNYGVEGDVSIFLTGGASKQENGLKLLGQVSVSNIDGCINELTVHNLVISGSNGKKYPCPPGIEKPIRFTLDDGKVGTDICAEEDDTRRALNIKRAIISLLQTETKPSTQTDIFGSCPTEAVSSQEGDSLLIHRNRDLTRCAHREQGKNDLVTAIYNPSAEIKNSQILRSTLNVESKVKHGVPEKVAAIEDYLYRPFSVGENGAKAKVLTKLTLTGKDKAGGASSKCTRRRTVIFENPHGAVVDSNSKIAYDVVKETAKNLEKEANSKSAGLFAQVVRIFRYTNKDDLMKVFNQAKNNQLEKRVYLDALLRAGTGYSIEAAVAILKTHSLSQLEEQLTYLSLGNARHVSSEAIKAVTTLLDNSHVPKDVYLGIGALAGTYCKQHDCHKSPSEGITVLSQKFAAKLQNCKPKSKVEEDVVVAVLKGIRNVRHLEDTIIDKLIRCASDNGVKPRVRAAALEAYLADPCASKIKKSGLDLMKNKALDSEIRIKAYLAVIACPCGSSANEIKNLLEHEQSQQVGRFITTSLRSIRASVNPDKILARQHYGLIGTPNKFTVDDRKYSFYRELSYNINSAGVGGNVEQTVIFSQDSFLPRSASLNLTAELFGHQFNVLEVGGRQGNLDRVVEHFLGPKSFLRTEDVQTIYDNLKKRYEESKKKVEDGLSRGRRSVKSDVDAFDKKLKAESTSYNNELDLDLYVKIFGTDAVFLSLGDDKGFDFNKVLDQLLRKVNSGFNHCKNLKEILRANMLFLDAELAYPTATGLPLKLDLVGAATGRLEIGTNIDFNKIFSGSDDRKVEIKLVPSTDIEVSGLFLVDTGSVAIGMKVMNNLHSSTGGHLIAKIIEGGRGFDIQFGLPIDKQEILTASNKLVFFVAEKGKKEEHVPLKVDTTRKDYSGCFDQLSGVLGLTVCGEVSIPFAVSRDEAQASISKFLARYPLTGDATVKLSLEKNDLRGYHIKGVLRNDNPERKGFELLFEAEGSQNRRTQLTGELVNCDTEKSIKLNLDSPIKVVSGELALYTKPNEYIILVKAKLDAAEIYGKAGFNVQGNEKRSVFKPVIEYQLSKEEGKQVMKVNGDIIREVNAPVTKYTIEGLKFDIPNSNECVDINGHLVTQPNGVEMDLKGKKGQYNVLLSGSVKNKDVKILFQNTLNPKINFKLNGHFEVGETIHNDFDIIVGGDLNNNQNRIVFNQLYKNYRKSENEFSVITKNKIEINPIDFKVKADAEVDAKKIDIELEGRYQNNKADFELKTRKHIKQADDYSVKLCANLNDRGIELVSKRDCVNADKSNFENYLLIKNFGKYELSGMVTHKNKPNDVLYGANGHFRVSGGSKTEDISFKVDAVKNAKECSSSAQISSTHGEILEYLVKVTHGANPSGQLKLVLKDSISANGQFKVTDADGKGNGMIIIEFKKAQRKIKGDVTFVSKDPIFNAEVDVYLNFDKDNNDKVHFSTNNKKTAKMTESKNKLVYAGKHSEVNVHTDGDLIEFDKVHANVEVILPTERCLNLKIARDVAVKDDVANGNVEFVLSDAVKRGGQASLISYKAKIMNTKLDDQIIHYEGHIDLKLKDGKQLQNAIVLSNDKEGDKYKYNFKYEVSGNLIPKRVSIVVYGKNLDSDDIIDMDYFSKGSYGDNIGYEIDGQYYVKLLEKGDKKYYDNYVVKLQTPYEKAHDLKYISTFLYTEPESRDLAEYDLKQVVQVNADEYKLDSKGTIKPSEGCVKLHLLAPHVEPFNIETKYNIASEGDKHTGNVEVKTQYGKGKSATVTIKGITMPRENEIQFSVLAPQADKFKKLYLNLKATTPGPDNVVLFGIVEVDNKFYKAQSNIVYSKSNPVFDLTYSGKKGALSRINVRGTTLSENRGKLTVQLNNVNEVDLDLTAEGGVQNENINLKFSATSNKLGLKNYKVDIHTKDANNGKRLEFEATNDNKNILSGSTTFISKQEDKKTIIEGSGSIKVKEEQKSATFKYIRTLLTEGNEQGIETFLNLAVGERSYVAESRVTNLEYKTSYLYCEEKKQCAHVDLISKMNIQKPGIFQHTVNVNFDLRKLGVAPEFGLQITNELAEKKLPQYTLDLHAAKDDKKYHLHIYSHPEHGRFPAGITISLPQRVLALETKLVYPTNKGMPLPIEGEITFHPDKRKPNYKTAGRFMVDVTGSKDMHTLIADFGFSHPKLGKEALVKIRGNLKTGDIIEIETSSSICHPVLGADRESKFLLRVGSNTFKFLLETPVVKVIDVEGTATVKDKLQQAELKFCLLQGKPVTVRAIIKDFQYYEFTTDESDRKLSVIGHLDPEKRVDISADIILSGEKKNIAHGALFLENNLVKSDYGISKENFKYFVNALKNDLKTLESRIKQIGQKTNADFKDIIKRVEPKIKELEKCYQEDLQKIYDEVTNDQTLKEISQALHEVVQFVAKIVDDIVKAFKPLVDKVYAVVTDLLKKISETYDKDIAPQIQQLYDSLGAVLKEFFDGLIDIVAHYAALVTDFFEKHKAELEELTNTVTEIFKDLTRLLVVQLKELKVNVAKILEVVVGYFNEAQMSFFGILKTKYEELGIADVLQSNLLELHNAIRVMLPSDETKNLADELYKFVAKKLRGEKFDEQAHLRLIYEKLTVAFTSLIKILRNVFDEYNMRSIFTLDPMTLLTSPGQLPHTPSSVGISLSLVNRILNGDIADPLALIQAYRPRSINLLEEIPVKRRAVIVNGQHIFTFDGRHLTFPGNCRYVLAHDFVDRNFTLVLQLQNGKPKAIILEDKSGITVELKDNGQVFVDGAAHGFPVSKKDVFAFKRPDGLLGIGSLYGVLAYCSPKLEVCYFEVNGFYLGKLRGLLGDANNELYDDFRMPNGKVTSSESEFANSYRLSSSCPQVKCPAHTHQQHHAALPTTCEQVFGAGSTLRPLNLLLDVAPFRQACIHAVAGNAANALREACDLGAGYAALALSTLLPAVLPPVCLRCEDAGTTKNVGDTFEMKLPNKQADILVIVETTKNNEKNYKNVAVPLVSQIVDNLKGKHLTDIKVHLVGVTSKYPYATVYDTDLKLKNAKIVFDDEHRYERTPILKTECELGKYFQIITNAIDQTRITLGLSNINSGYREAIETPLRPGALKHIVVVNGDACQFEIGTPLQIVNHAILLAQTGATQSIVATVPDTKVDGKDSPKLIGYTIKSALLLDAKKHAKEFEGVKVTNSEENFCVDLAETTDALVLSASNFLKMDAAEQKQYLHAAANTITQKMNKSIVQECMCNYANPFIARSYCVVQSKKELARRRK